VTEVKAGIKRGHQTISTGFNLLKRVYLIERGELRPNKMMGVREN
jgi:hypothetical protein